MTDTAKNALRDQVKRDADRFFEWPGEDRSTVTTVSALLFAEHIAADYERQIAAIEARYESEIERNDRTALSRLASLENKLRKASSTST